MCAELMRILAKAQITMHDEERGLVMVWNGGQGIHAYNVEGKEVSYWMLGGGETRAKPADVRRSMRARIKSGEY